MREVPVKLDRQQRIRRTTDQHVKIRRRSRRSAHTHCRRPPHSPAKAGQTKTGTEESMGQRIHAPERINRPGGSKLPRAATLMALQLSTAFSARSGHTRATPHATPSVTTVPINVNQGQNTSAPKVRIHQSFVTATFAGQ